MQEVAPGMTAADAVEDLLLVSESSVECRFGTNCATLL